MTNVILPGASLSDDGGLASLAAVIDEERQHEKEWNARDHVFSTINWVRSYKSRLVHIYKTGTVVIKPSLAVGLEQSAWHSRRQAKIGLYSGLRRSHRTDAVFAEQPEETVDQECQLGIYSDPSAACCHAAMVCRENAIIREMR